MKTIQTRGRTLDIAAPVYDFTEPLVLFGKQKEINQLLIELLEVRSDSKILDVGCGTGVLSEKLSRYLNAIEGGMTIGIDAAHKMIEAAERKRANENCLFKLMAAEQLDFPDDYFDGVVSSFFYHHVDLDLKQKSLSEAYRVLKPGGQLVVADMHIPTTFIGALTSYTARWMFMQPEIAENIRGVLPECITQAGFSEPTLVKTFLGYVAVFKAIKIL